MGRAFRAIQTKELPALFSFFGLRMRQEVVESHRDAISARFAAEVGEIVRLCSGLRERERYQLFREALRLAYESATRREPRAPRGPLDGTSGTQGWPVRRGAAG